MGSVPGRKASGEVLSLLNDRSGSAIPPITLIGYCHLCFASRRCDARAFHCDSFFGDFASCYAIGPSFIIRTESLIAYDTALLNNTCTRVPQRAHRCAATFLFT